MSRARRPRGQKKNLKEEGDKIMNNAVTLKFGGGM
jgi:hypothetical protein